METVNVLRCKILNETTNKYDWEYLIFPEVPIRTLYAYLKKDLQDEKLDNYNITDRFQKVDLNKDIWDMKRILVFNGFFEAIEYYYSDY